MHSPSIKLPFFLGLLLSMSLPMEGAELGNGSLQGNYFFTLHKVEASVLGFLFTNAVGTLAFDGSGRVIAQGAINRDGAIQSLNASGTYSLDSRGGVQLSIPGIPLNVVGSIAFDLNSLLATSVGSANLQSHEILVATKPPPPPYSNALLTGRYFLVERTITATGGTPRLENGTGAITFDGAGNYTLELTTNRGGSTTTASLSGTYGVAVDGRVALALPGRNDPVILGITPDGSLAIGATLSARSSNTFDLFALTKADSTGLGTAGLGG